MAITKRGPKLPRPVKARDILFAHAAKKGPSSKNSLASKAENSGVSVSDTESSFSPSQAHPSRILPCRNKTTSNEEQYLVPSPALNNPIQMLSVGTCPNSSSIPDFANGLHATV